jgi:MoaA/NifB/PqqE/SkfB family radical SAM enzyme
VSFGRTLRRAPRLASVLWRLGRGRTAFASVNLLNRCNQACPMCAVHGGPDVQLTLPDLERTFDALVGGGIRVIELSGGEPFLRRDLPAVVAALEARDLLYSFNTNGTAIDDAGLRALAAGGGLLQVALSLDSLDRERYRLLRGRDLLPQALGGLAQLEAALHGTTLKLNMALSRHNRAEVADLLAFAKGRGLFLSVFPVNQGPGVHRSDGGAFQDTAAEREEMAATFDRLARLRRWGEPLWEPSAFYRAAAAYLRGGPNAPCGAGRLYLDVRADGTVAPCVDLPSVATLDDLGAGRAWAALEAAQPAVARCRASTPCCYTCTVNLAETGRHPLAVAAETALVLLRSWGRRRLGAAAR